MTSRATGLVLTLASFFAATAMAAESGPGCPDLATCIRTLVAAAEPGGGISRREADASKAVLGFGEAAVETRRSVGFAVGAVTGPRVVVLIGGLPPAVRCASISAPEWLRVPAAVRVAAARSASARVAAAAVLAC